MQPHANLDKRFRTKSGICDKRSLTVKRARKALHNAEQAKEKDEGIIQKLKDFLKGKEYFTCHIVKR